MGHTVSEHGISCSQKKIKAVQEWPIPRSKSDLKSFLGLLNYYRKYIANFSMKAYPLIQLTRKNMKFVWDENCQFRFERLKHMLVSVPILCLPEREGKIILDTDGCNMSIGAVPSQIQNGE